MAKKKTAATATEPEATTNPAQEAQEPPQEAPAAPEVQQPAPEPETPQEPPQAPEDGPQDPDPEPQPVDADTPFPCRATVTAALAILRRTVGPGTADMLKPVATLKRGTEITVIQYRDGNAQLANGLWTSADCLTR